MISCAALLQLFGKSRMSKKPIPNHSIRIGNRFFISTVQRSRFLTPIHSPLAAHSVGRFAHRSQSKKSNPLKQIKSQRKTSSPLSCTVTKLSPLDELPAEFGREGNVFTFSIVASRAIVGLFALCLLVALPPIPCNAEQALRL